jgi:diguanylate cyclase (GGDEF)-like protein
MIVLEGITPLKRVARNVCFGLLACGCLIVVGHFLRQFNIVVNPLVWSSEEIISALLSFTIAANVLVRYHGTGNRVSLLLGLTFGIGGFIHLGAIFEFYYHFVALSQEFRVPLSWMVGQTLQGLLLLVAYALNKRLPWPREPRRNMLAVLATIICASYLITTVFLAFPNKPPIERHSIVPRPWDLLPAVIFIAAAVVLHRTTDDREHFAFDSVLVWVAGLNAASHLIVSQSVRLLDAPAAFAQLINTSSYMILLGATLLDNAKLFGQVRILAISDSLTGLANYRRLVDVVQSELERSGRTNRPFSLLLMDLDGLKIINDRFGHLAGSRSLCRVADILRVNSRSVDTPARYGGDEFALVLPETTEFAARQVADRVQKCLESDREEPSLRMSIGVASFPESGITAHQLFEVADQELYKMKARTKSAQTSRPKR